MKRFTFLKRKAKLLRRDNRLKVDAYRVYFFKSNKHYYASLIENNTGNVLSSVSTQKVSTTKKTSLERVTDLAVAFSDKLQNKDFIDFNNVDFDRGVYRFHGLVKHFVQEIRQRGIEV